ncbi:MAG: hypothetical protein IJ668_08370 [Selenomonadaceae bacterium]|nr:hypothetical protein [Selenomonadaceae bacterium]MBR1580495.1 hypothetical protein [Selenomonadaceae bacterium]
MNDLEERKQKAMAEIKELVKWANAESDKVIAQMKSEGIKIGLDGHQERFAYIREIERRRMREIVAKYDLPYEVKI